ncbi:MAG: HlyD family efflux transporter periplasmic adaptor subunit [Thermodesulfobacteriota bacterium]
MAAPRPVLRQDLVILPRLDGEGSFRYLVRDPRSGELFDLGEEEIFLCQQLDGSRERAAVGAAFAERFGKPISDDSLGAFIRHLGSLGLLAQRTGEETLVGADEGTKHRLGNPDRLLTFLKGQLGWCFSSFGLGLVAALACLALGVAAAHGGDLLHELRMIGRQRIMVAVPLFWIFGIIPAAEGVKALACQVRGGHVHEICLVWVYRVIPHIYANLSDVFWVMDKKARLRVLRAGLIFRLVLISLGLLVWVNVAPGSTLRTFSALFVCAAVINLVLEALPLLQRDGYLLFAAWTEQRDLWYRARTLLKAQVLGRPQPEPLAAGEGRRFLVFGLLAWLAQYGLLALVLSAVGLELVERFQGVGAGLFLIILGLRCEPFLRGQLERLPGRASLPVLANQHGRVWLSRLVWIVLLLGFAVVLFLPYPYEVGGEFRIVPGTQYGVRAPVAGEVETVTVVEGQAVKKGDVVAVFQTRDARMRVEAAQAAVDDLKARLRLLREGAKPEEIALAEQQVSAAAKAAEYSQAQARRYEEMARGKAASAEELETALRSRDLDRERLELARRGLALARSGARGAEIQAAEAELRRQEVLLDHAREDLRLTTVVSPADGRIITPRVEETRGQYLAEGELFLVVECDGPLRAEVEVPEDEITDVVPGARVRLRTWADPDTTYLGSVREIAPVAYDKSLKRVRRTLTQREEAVEQREILRDQGKAVRLVCDLTLPEGMVLRSDMTGWAKIESSTRPVAVAFTRWLVRFVMVEVWSWIP